MRITGSVTFPLGMILLVLLLFTVAKCYAHDSWISKGGYRNLAGEWCCGENDCKPVAAATRRDGYFVPASGEVVPFAEATPSPDGQFWLCRRTDQSRRCFFAPPPNS